MVEKTVKWLNGEWLKVFNHLTNYYLTDSI